MAQKGSQIMGRACLCLSLHLVSPLRKFTWRKLRKLRKSGWCRSRLLSAPETVRRAALLAKVGPAAPGAHFFYAPLTFCKSCAASAI